MRTSFKEGSGDTPSKKKARYSISHVCSSVLIISPVVIRVTLFFERVALGLSLNIDAACKMARPQVSLRLSCLLLLGLWTYVQAEEIDLHLSNPPLFDYGTHTGDIELKDLSSVNDRRLALPFNISYLGSSYKTLYVSKDGLLSFDPSVQYLRNARWQEGSISKAYDKPFLAPFYFDGYEPIVDDYIGEVLFRLIDKNKLDGDEHESEYRRLLRYMNEYVPSAVVNPPENFDAQLIVVVTWVDVTDSAQKEEELDGGEYCGPTSEPCKSATFQAVIVADSVNTFAIFNYAKMDIPITGNYQAGFNGGYRRGWYNVIPCQEECLANLNASNVNDLPSHTGSDVMGRYILSVGHEVIIRGGCLPPELVAGTLEVYPREVGMFGGELLEVSGKCAGNSNPVHCRFSYDDPSAPVKLYVQTEGQMRNGMKGFCPVPRMTWTGPTVVSWSSDGVEWSTHRSITVVLPDRMERPVPVPDAIEKQWYSQDSETITVVWDPDNFSPRGSQAEVEITLLGYMEDEQSGTVRFSTLESFGRADNSAGQFTFTVSDHRCKKDCEKFEQALLEVSLPPELYAQAKERVALRYGPIPLGWYVNEELTKVRGGDWSNQKCHEWHSKDSADEKWVEEIIPCPCSLDQALADFGRFQPDPGCNLYTGSACYFHIGAKHCVRSVVPSKAGAGNQCCYNHDGTLRYSQLSYQGSTPDRGHVWGAHPFGRPDHVPSLSHWKNDVIPLYYCCLWNDYQLCDLYMEQRPTADCRNYDVPGIAFLRGDPHVTTFDGLAYHFGGKGDFWLVRGPGFQMQGRFGDDFAAAPKQNVGSTALKMLAIRVPGAPEILVWPAPERAITYRGLDILVENERRFFYSKSTMWQDFQGGVSVVNNAADTSYNRHDNFTILINDVGVNVVAAHGLLHIVVALPPSMKPANQNGQKTAGLLGAYDGKSLDDFTSKEGTVTAVGEQNRNIYENFALSWKVEDAETLFKYPKSAWPLSSYTPYYEYSEIPNNYNGAPQEGTIAGTCQTNDRCRWDYRVTGNRAIAQDTRDADKRFDFVSASAYKVENCGLPDVGLMAVMDSHNFSVGREVKVTGCENGKYFSGEATYSCVRERLDTATELERADYGIKVVDEDDNVEYIIHWLPRPGHVCTIDDPAADIGIIVAIAVGTGPPPVYRPSGDPVRMSGSSKEERGLQGSNV
ncbi:sushi domain-containing protein 2 [Aplysia californica]|uniref:Sushi domain-containing protein 2 n=1 Tax=Aplysia californica TaxID=6500 RepID=A0ABM1A4Y5_APLCA|nr:sushi domain-containing protein 2 [Aplysia californica]